MKLSLRRGKEMVENVGREVRTDAGRVVSADGKTCRGAVAADGSRVQLFSMLDQATGLPLGQVQIEGGD
jgi:hypothetical protein